MSSTSAEAKAEAALWRFARALYAAPGVQDACLTLQDAFGENVPFALFAVWAARRGGMSNAAATSAAADDAAWSAASVAPLRAIRRALKPRLAAFAALGLPEAEAFRARIKALELEAEWLELALLARRAAQDQPSPCAPPPDWRAVALRLWRAGRSAPEPDALALFNLLLAAAEPIDAAAMETDAQQP